MSNSLFGKAIISMADLERDSIEMILKMAQQLKTNAQHNLLQNKIIASCFFEASTRTRLSFEAAVYRQGGKIIGFSDADQTSYKKGESLYDTIKVISHYCDAIILRHPIEGAARLAAEISAKPVINAGDGANQHPTQTLLDLFTIQESQNKLDNLNIAFMGDLKYGRTVHSLCDACAWYNARLFFIAPEGLMMPSHICDQLKKRGIRFSLHASLEEVLDKLDILYVTRIQKERFDVTEFKALQTQYFLTPRMLEKAKPNLRILHPLPRIDEIDVSMDETPYAYYFTQAANGLYVRQAILALLLNQDLPI